MYTSRQKDIVAGSIWDDAFPATNEKYLSGRMPYIGQRVELSDGRVFRFAKANDTIARGVICAYVPNTQAIAITYFGSAVGTANIAGEGGAVGDTVVRLTDDVSGVTANEFAGGYLCITTDASGDSEGYMYHIKKNEATGAAGAGYRVWIEQPGIRVALTQASVGTMVANPWNNITTHVAGDYNGTTTTFVVGVAAVAATATNCYFWVQTWGPCICLAGTGTIKVGADVGPAIDDHGAVQACECVTTETQTASIGVGMANTADTVWGPVFLRISP